MRAWVSEYVFVCVCIRPCVRACVRAHVRVCVRVCVRARASTPVCLSVASWIQNIHKAVILHDYVLDHFEILSHSLLCLFSDWAFGSDFCAMKPMKDLNINVLREMSHDLRDWQDVKVQLLTKCLSLCRTACPSHVWKTSLPKGFSANVNFCFLPLQVRENVPQVWSESSELGNVQPC